MIRILIADDHPVVRQRLKQLLQESFPAAFLAEAFDTTSLLNEAFNGEWDIIVSDLAMPGGGGIVALEKIKQTKPELPVLIVSSYPENQYALRVVNAGAVAFINKDHVDTELVKMVKHILEKTNS